MARLEFAYQWGLTLYLLTAMKAVQWGIGRLNAVAIRPATNCFWNMAGESIGLMTSLPMIALFASKLWFRDRRLSAFVAICLMSLRRYRCDLAGVSVSIFRSLFCFSILPTQISTTKVDANQTRQEEVLNVFLLCFYQGTGSLGTVTMG